MRGMDGLSPEREGHAAPIEYVCSIGSRLYAFEHTGIEPFPRQIEMQERHRKFFQAVIDHFTGTLSADECFQLRVPVDAASRVKNSRIIATVQKTLIEWIGRTALTLPIADYGRYVLPIDKVALPGVPFEVSLHRMKALGPMRGRFDVAALVPNEVELEAARRERLDEACAKKFGKLATWKAACGARTVLILEEADIQLTNDQVVAEALDQAEANRENRPDEVYLVSTCTDDSWWITCLRRDATKWPDDDAERSRFWQVEPAVLTPLTDR